MGFGAFFMALVVDFEREYPDFGLGAVDQSGFLFHCHFRGYIYEIPKHL